MNNKPIKLKEWCEELGTYVNVVKWTPESIAYEKRKDCADKYNVTYGKKLMRLDITKKLNDLEFEIVASLISEGNSVEKSYYMMLDAKRNLNNFD